MVTRAVAAVVTAARIRIGCIVAARKHKGYVTVPYFIDTMSPKKQGDGRIDILTKL